MKDTEQAKLFEGLRGVWSGNPDKFPKGVSLIMTPGGARLFFEDGVCRVTTPARKVPLDQLRRDIAKIAPGLPTGFSRTRKGEGK